MGNSKKTQGRGYQVHVDRAFKPHHDAMLQALRVVLGLPRMPVVLNDKGKPEGRVE